MLATCLCGELAVAQARSNGAAEEAVLEEVFVVGRRDILAPPTRAPQNSVLAYDEQVSLNRTAGDWLALLPGVSLNGQGGLLQSYSVRGFSRARIRTELVGVPVFSDRRAGTSMSFVPPDLIEEVRVDRGAASALYGSGAMGGVVSLAPVKIRGQRVLLDARDNDGQIAATVMGGDGEHVGAGVSVRRADDARSPDGQTLNTAYEQVAGLLEAGGSFDTRDWSLTWIPSIGRDIGRSNALYPDRRVSTAPEDDHSVLRFEIRDGNRWLLRTYHHYQDWSSDVLRVGERRNLTRYRAHTVGSLLHGSSATFGGEGSWGMEWVGRHGVEIQDQEFSANGELLIAQELVDGGEDTLGVFFDQSWRFGATELRGGLRGDFQRQHADGRSTDDTHGSARVRLDHALTSAWTLGAEVATGYRFPSISERYFSGTTPRGEVIGNPDLAAETRTSLEASVTFEPGQLPLSLEATAYHSDLDDYIERFFLSPGVIAYRNLSRASIDGAEIAVRLRLGAWAHRVSYQWQEGEDADQRTLADLNPPELRYMLQWERGPYAVAGDLTHRPQRSDAGLGEIPLGEATVVSMRAAWALGSRWSAELYGTNLFDESFRASADDFAPLQPGRTIGLRLAWEAD